MIRRARPQDAEAMHDAHMRSIREVCSKDHTPEEISGWGNRPYNAEKRLRSINEHDSWVVEIDGKIEGYGSLEVRLHEGRLLGHFYGLYLAPAAIGKGFGKELAQKMMALSRQKGAEAITLKATLTAHGFYQSMGFEDVGPQLSVEIGGAPVRCQPMQLDLI